MNFLIRSPNWIGDTVLSTALVKLLKEKLEDIKITILVKEYVKELWMNNPYIDEIISFKADISGYFELFNKLNAKKFDISLILPNSFSSAFIAYIAGIKERIGYNTRDRGFLLTKKIELNGTRKKHLIYEYLEFAKIFGIDINVPKPELYVTDEENCEADRILRKEKINVENRIIGICPGATFGPAKRWEKDNWKELIKKLIQKDNVKILMFGNKNEENLLTEINNVVENKCIIFSDINLRSLISLINKCKIFISNDTGPMHIASSVKIPVVAIFGSSSPAWTAPLGDNNKVIYKSIFCSPCFKKICNRQNVSYECLTSITPEEVLSAVESLASDK